MVRDISATMVPGKLWRQRVHCPPTRSYLQLRVLLRISSSAPTLRLHSNSWAVVNLTGDQAGRQQPTQTSIVVRRVSLRPMEFSSPTKRFTRGSALLGATVSCSTLLRRVAIFFTPWFRVRRNHDSTSTTLAG